MVLGYHVIVGAYGFWLPNDPRGSWSDFVRAWELRRFGPARKVDTRRSVAGRLHDRAFRLAAKQALRYPAVSFTGNQARAIGMGFGNFVERSGVVVGACSIMPEPFHLVIARHTYEVEKSANLLKGAATRELLEAGPASPCRVQTSEGRHSALLAQGEWKVFLDSEEDIVRAIRYVESNPVKEGKPRQNWNFVTPFFV